MRWAINSRKRSAIESVDAVADDDDDVEPVDDESERVADGIDDAASS